MTKKDLCLTVWGQIVQETKLFAHQVLDKVTLHRPSPSSPGSTHGSTTDHHHSRPHQQQYSSPHHQQGQHQERRKQPHQYQHRPLSPHYQQIYTPYRHVYFSSTLSLNIRPTTSCTSLSTINSSTIASVSNSNELLASQQYESLWEVQLALGEIPGMIEGNILESCEDSTAASIDTAALVTVASMPSSSLLLPPLLPPTQQLHTSLLSITSTSSQPQPRRTFVALEEFPRHPSTFEDSDSESDYNDSEDDEKEEEKVDAVESFIFEPLPQQPPQPHPLLRVYSSYQSSNNLTTSSLYLPLTTTEHASNNVNNTTGSTYSIEPHPLQQHQDYEEEEEEEVTLTFSRRLFRGDTTTTTFNAIAPTSNTSSCINTDNSTGTGALHPSDLRSDRKDSGVFIHDEQDGIIVKLSPRLIFSSSESESESESEHNNSYGPQYRSSTSTHPSEHTDLRSRWMNGVTCIPNTSSSNVNGFRGEGARDRRNNTTALQRREYIASTSFSSSSTTTSTSTTSTFPSLMAAVTFISLQA
ncbi:hypothetical protein BG015_010902 [Linnemannia schmuckeri]|uniref:Uncharacterized protein n=1 Tax=Linnemannia schmuckeri TaxID=64567 RepID=A0A9P5RVI2_9FUNG|nr:hypothetical protein BG015_010902 [Linnemannia schmuckeri]